jgi:hypothetical protein
MSVRLIAMSFVIVLLAAGCVALPEQPASAPSGAQPAAASAVPAQPQATPVVPVAGTPKGTPGSAPVVSPVPATAVADTAGTVSPAGSTEVPPMQDQATPAYPRYGHAADWSWVAGQILPSMQMAACWTVLYDQTGGGAVYLTALPKGAAENDYVVLHGALASADGTACAGRGQIYVVQNVQGVPPASSSTASHATDFSWVTGTYAVTRIQGGCAYLTYDPSGSDAYGGRFAVPRLADVPDGTLIRIYGQINTTGPREMCPGQAYSVATYEIVK